MKTSLICLLIAVALRVVFAQIVDTSPNLKAEPREIILADKIHGVWLRIVRTNSKDKDAKGYDPSYTSLVLAKELRATGRKLSDGSMEIQFRSEIAKDLP